MWAAWVWALGALVGRVAGEEAVVVVGGEGGADPSGAHQAAFFNVLASDDTPRPTFTLPAERGRNHGRALFIGQDSLLLLGGENSGDAKEKSLLSADVLSLRSGTLRTSLAMKEFRSSPAVALLNGDAVVCGGLEGHSEKQCSLDSCERFDGVQWRYIAPMTKKRGEATLTEHAGLLYAFGGNVEADGDCTSPTYDVLDHGERYDPALDRWDTLPPMPKPRYAHAAASVGDHVWLCGGHAHQSDDDILRSCDRFNHRTTSWDSRPEPEMRRGRQTFSLLHSHGLLLAVGGASRADWSKGSQDQTPSTVEELDLATMKWTERSKRLPFPAYGAAVALWPQSLPSSAPQAPHKHWALKFTTPAPRPPPSTFSSPAPAPSPSTSLLSFVLLVFIALLQ